ncbi:phosphate signaling complex protein PhoU [Cytobacillus spongiae]|jgi:phosphate transport system protein|uniref:phosphate signaling complex protein PhoU n=1 Tax=Cytobacillus spongiae TaxID=2901381 RepID=UPI001F21191A|nr:phosphate signaling complex protein PhoU [Cytobacillus spongiae]UII54871.1 phosphate signaling complex protein PhoU [Cytobacillus spongiae]
MLREKFHLDLEELINMLVELGQFADNALKASIDALDTKDVDKAIEIMENDVKADVMYEEINDFAILLIAKQQPVAIDLRRIIVAIKIATDIERIADYAVNVAKSAIRIGNETHVKPIEHVKEMYVVTSRMLQLALEAYKEEDLKKAKKVAEMDDEVDSLYGQTIQELLRLNQEKPEYLAQITQLSFTSRYLERAADHVTNIAESVFYLVKGLHYDLNN